MKLLRNVFAAVPNPCAMNNGGCGRDAVCLLSFNRTARCRCPHLRRLKADNKTCEGQRGPILFIQSFLLYKLQLSQFLVCCQIFFIYFSLYELLYEFYSISTFSLLLTFHCINYCVNFALLQIVHVEIALFLLNICGNLPSQTNC